MVITLTATRRHWTTPFSIGLACSVSFTGQCEAFVAIINCSSTNRSAVHLHSSITRCLQLATVNKSCNTTQCHNRYTEPVLREWSFKPGKPVLLQTDSLYKRLTHLYDDVVCEIWKSGLLNYVCSIFSLQLYMQLDMQKEASTFSALRYVTHLVFHLKLLKLVARLSYHYTNMRENFSLIA